MTPYGGSTGNATVGFYLFNAYATSGPAETNFFRSVDGQTFGEHFVSPMFVLLPDHRLEVVGFNSNQQTFDIRVTGLLVNNVTYLPVLRNVN